LNGGAVVIYLQWNDPFGASGNDYDLILFDNSTGALLTASSDFQSGSQDPTEQVVWVNSSGITQSYAAVIGQFSGSARTFDMFVLCFGCATYSNNAQHNFNTASSSVPANSDAGGGIVTAGTINASEPGNDNITSYSSLGPTNDGRTKPDITGIDGVSITGAGGFPNPFYGTSAAAPHIGAIAALVLACQPQLKTGEPGDNPASDRTAMRNALLNSATDLGAGGMDNVYGAKRANALPACTCVEAHPSAAPPLAGPAYYHPVTPARILDTRTSTGGFPSKIRQGWHASVQVTGVGGVPASGVTAVVMNTTVTEVSAPSYLTVYPSGVARPL